MRYAIFIVATLLVMVGIGLADEPLIVVKPEAFKTLVNPACSHCVDEAKRRGKELKPDDRILAWTRGYSDGGAIPIRFFLNPYRVISDSYGVFVHDPDAGYSRGFAPSYDFRFHGWRNGVMVMKHKDGTLYSCLSGAAFDGPKKGTRLTAVPTVVSEWGYWLENYPNAVAYHMFDKYQPVERSADENADSVQSRGKPDPRLSANDQVLGVWTGKRARAFPLAAIEKSGFIAEDIDGEPLVVLWEGKTKTASAFRPVASQPRKFKGPEPDASGILPADEGIPIPDGSPVLPPRNLTFGLAPKMTSGQFQDAETKSLWDVAGRCVAGELKGFTLEWVDSVQVKWFAWAGEHPTTTIFAPSVAALPKPPPSLDELNKNVKAIAGMAEFLRLLPKPFATVASVDPKAHTVTMTIDGEKNPKTWPLEPDAEVKIGGWWGRLEQIAPGARVWVWLKPDRKKNPVSIVMLADDISEFDMHGSLRQKPGEKPKWMASIIDAKKADQKAWLRNRWIDTGLPGTLTFHHVFSGELEIALDHEAMRWGRSLSAGDMVYLQADPPIKAVVKKVASSRERTILRVVVGELESSELTMGQRLAVKMTPPPEAIENSLYPPGLDAPRPKGERIEWFLANTYCTCLVSKNTCTGHFYTLASCNPNGCGMPSYRREQVGGMIDRGMTDRKIFDELVEESGPLLLRPHLMP